MPKNWRSKDAIENQHRNHPGDRPGEAEAISSEQVPIKGTAFFSTLSNQEIVPCGKRKPILK